jgi:hypothetical protein
MSDLGGGADGAGTVGSGRIVSSRRRSKMPPPGVVLPGGGVVWSRPIAALVRQQTIIVARSAHGRMRGDRQHSSARAVQGFGQRGPGTVSGGAAPE